MSIFASPGSFRSASGTGPFAPLPSFWSLERGMGWPRSLCNHGHRGDLSQPMASMAHVESSPQGLPVMPVASPHTPTWP
jgi:hypothetical protein